MANFHWYLKHITVHLQLIHGNEVSEAIRTMTPATITILPAPTPQPDPKNVNGLPIPISEIDTYLWKEKHRKATTKLHKNKEKHGSCVHHHFSSVYAQS